MSSPSIPSTSPPCCQVEHCPADLSGLRAYYLRYRICEHHSKAEEVVCSGERCRFCQLCGRFHPLAAFNSGRRSCKARLAKHNERRKELMKRKADGAAGGYGSAPKGKRGRAKSFESEPETDADSNPSTADNEPQVLYYQDDEMLDNCTLMQEFHLVRPHATASRHIYTHQPCTLPKVNSKRTTLALDMPEPACDLEASFPASSPPPADLNGTAGSRCHQGAASCAHSKRGCSPQQHVLLACQKQSHVLSAPHPGCSASSGESQQSGPPTCLHHHSASCSLGPSLSAGTASDEVTRREELGLVHLWRQWGGDERNLIDPAMCNLALLGLVAPGTLRVLGDYQPLDSLWHSIQPTACPDPLQMAMPAPQRCC